MKKAAKKEGTQLPTLSGTEQQVLKLMIDGSQREWYGLELVKASEQGLKRGTIYVTLGRMEEKGFVTSTKEAATDERVIPRRLYKVTGHGAKVYAAYQAAYLALEGALA